MAQASDFDLGTSSIVTKTDRYVWRMDWIRDRTTKNEGLSAFLTETVKVNNAGSKTVSAETFVVSLNDTILNNFRGHNTFLTDMKAMVNQCVTEYQASGSLLDSINTGSITVLT
jgi:hypothetical protein